MRKFDFSLERILEYRRLAEGWAKDAYFEAIAKRIQAEEAIERVQEKRMNSIARSQESLIGRRTLQTYLDRLDDEERDLSLVAELLLQDEESARTSWVEARRDAEALSKLRQKRLAEWNLEFARWEQRQLDEWAVTRGRAA